MSVMVKLEVRFDDTVKTIEVEVEKRFVTNELLLHAQVLHPMAVEMAREINHPMSKVLREYRDEKASAPAALPLRR